MTKRTTILITSLVLVAAIAVAGVLMRRDGPVSSQTANAPVATGISLIFDAPLSHELVATVTDSSSTTVKEATLEKNASRFNFDLPSGVYVVSLKSTDNSIPPLDPTTVTVAEGILSELQISIPHEEEQ